MYMSTDSNNRELSDQDIQEGLDELSLNTNLAQIDLVEKNLLKTYMQVELNEFFQEKMESDMFDDLDEDDKSLFVGNFFMWVKKEFKNKQELTLVKRNKRDKN